MARQGIGEFEQAIDDLDQAIELGAQQTRVYLLRSRVHKRLGNTAQAKADLDTFLHAIPSDELSWISRGFVQTLESNPQQAKEDYLEVLKRNPDSTIALQNLAALQSDKFDDLPGAIESYDRIIRLKPKDAKAIATRGVLHGRAAVEELAEKTATDKGSETASAKRKIALRDASRALKLSRDADVLCQVADVFALTSKIEPADAKMAMRLLNDAARQDPSLVLLMIQTDVDLKPLEDDSEFEKLSQLLSELAKKD